MEVGGACPHGHELTEANAYVSPKGIVACRVCKKDAADRFKAKRDGEKIDIPAPRHFKREAGAKQCWWCGEKIHVDAKPASRFCWVHVDSGSSFCVPSKSRTGSHAALLFDIGERKYKGKTRGAMKE